VAKDPAPPPKPRRELPSNRVALVGLGVGFGALWGGVMWLLRTLLGADSGTRGLLYLVITMAMIGGGVAAIFGASMVRRRGERVAPKLRRRK
jgi:hypothetical protein